MIRVRRNGYVFESWGGDYPPRYVHVSSSKGELLGRVRLDTKAPFASWKIPRRVLKTIEELQNETAL